MHHPSARVLDMRKNNLDILAPVVIGIEHLLGGYTSFDPRVCSWRRSRERRRYCGADIELGFAHVFRIIPNAFALTLTHQLVSPDRIRDNMLCKQG